MLQVQFMCRVEGIPCGVCLADTSGLRLSGSGRPFADIVCFCLCARVKVKKTGRESIKVNKTSAL